MPGISGLEVLDRLADMQTDMLTIMITAYASIETAVSATKRGAYDFLAKPFTPDELKSTIRKAAARLILAKQARKLAEEKQQVRFEFIRVLAHELKAPLNAVAGYLELIQKRDTWATSVAGLRRNDRPQPASHRRHAQADPRPARLDADRVGPRQPATGRGRSAGRWPRPPSKPCRPRPTRGTSRIRASCRRRRLDDGRCRRNRNDPEQPDLQRRQVQPRRRERGRDACPPRLAGRSSPWPTRASA